MHLQDGGLHCLNSQVSGNLMKQTLAILTMGPRGGVSTGRIAKWWEIRNFMKCIFSPTSKNRKKISLIPNFHNCLGHRSVNMYSPVADFPIGIQWETLKINNSCSLGAIIPKMLRVTLWVSPYHASKLEVNWSPNKNLGRGQSCQNLPCTAVQG